MKVTKSRNKHEYRKKKKKREREREEVVSELTKARFLFRLRKTSCFLIDFKLAMSPSSSKAYFMASATYLALPC